MIIKRSDSQSLIDSNQSFCNYRDFMSDFFEIFRLIKPNIWFWDDKIVDSRKLMLVLLWSNHDSKLLDHINLNYKTIKNNMDLYCIWNNWFESFLWNWFNLLWYCNIISDIKESNLNDVWDYIGGLKYGKYDSVNICYLDNAWSVVDFDLFPICRLDIDYFCDKFSLSKSILNNEINELCILPWDNEIEESLLLQYIQHVIYWVVLEHNIYNFHKSKYLSWSILNKIIVN